LDQIEEQVLMPYRFKILKDVKIPERVLARQGGGGGLSYGFPWDDLKPGSDGFYIPREFWVEIAQLTNEHIDKPKEGKKLSGVSDLKDRVRRAFYIWRDRKKEERKNLAILIEDALDDEGKYTGMTVYMVTGNGATEVRKEAEGDAPTKGGRKKATA
jgi:hypothetical protein